jgi:hypothetical protein
VSGLSVIMLSVIMLSVIMLNVIMLNVVLLNVAAPSEWAELHAPIHGQGQMRKPTK